jgi:hypothetical protein
MSPSSWPSLLPRWLAVWNRYCGDARGRCQGEDSMERRREALALAVRAREAAAGGEGSAADDLLGQALTALATRPRDTLDDAIALE